MLLVRTALAALAAIALATPHAIPSAPVDGSVAERGAVSAPRHAPGRERLAFNADWKFHRFTANPDNLTYDADLKAWYLPTANDFVSKPFTRPSGSGPRSPYAGRAFNDAGWTSVDLPHDWAIAGPFQAPGVSSAMGLLPSNGVGWYRKTFKVPTTDAGRTIFLDIDGSQAYAGVWLNGRFVGGWAYGYNSWRVDLSPYLAFGAENVIAIRLENALDGSRWYSGGGLTRNVWLVKLDPVHVGQTGTFITTQNASTSSALLSLGVTVENTGKTSASATITTSIYRYDVAAGKETGDVLATFAQETVDVGAGARATVNSTATVPNPALWGPRPEQTPHLHIAITSVGVGGRVVDTFSTKFGIRTVEYDADSALHINGQRVYAQGVCMHDDRGSIGAVVNYRAHQRQLEGLVAMGSNAIRTSHNPPSPEMLDLADEMGFIVLDEIFDVWKDGKTANDFHLIFDEWHEADLRIFIRRDRNHPSVVMWSYGNEIPNQDDNDSGTPQTSQALLDIVHDEDPTRPGTNAMNTARANSDFAKVPDVKSLNYQGEGWSQTGGPLWPSFHAAFPSNMMWTSESASHVSSRGTYYFPVAEALSNSLGPDIPGSENATEKQVSAYDCYSNTLAAEEVFVRQDLYQPWVGGEFVWSCWDYLGEPYPFDGGDAPARSSYFGIIDLAGFPKTRYWMYQARWAPDVKSAHLIPHWTWPEHPGQVTPVHCITSADTAELFVNGESQGQLTNTNSSLIRFRWDDVAYQPGNITCVATKDGKHWATETVVTAGDAAAIKLTVDRSDINADGYDLAFITAAVVDANGVTVPRATNSITFAASGNGGRIVATDNGDPTDYTAFPSLTRKAFSGLALAVVQADTTGGKMIVTVTSSGLSDGNVAVNIG